MKSIYLRIRRWFLDHRTQSCCTRSLHQRFLMSRAELRAGEPITNELSRSWIQRILKVGITLLSDLGLEKWNYPQNYLRSVSGLLHIFKSFFSNLIHIISSRVLERNEEKREREKERAYIENPYLTVKFLQKISNIRRIRGNYAMCSDLASCISTDHSIARWIRANLVEKWGSPKSPPN